MPPRHSPDAQARPLRLHRHRVVVTACVPGSPTPQAPPFMILDPVGGLVLVTEWYGGPSAMLTR